MVREGYLVRRRGSGTFVSEPKIAQELTHDLVQRRHAPPRHAAGQPDALARDHDGGRLLGRCLHVSPSEKIVVARRLRLADGETMAIETLHVPESLVPDLDAEGPREASFYDLLENRYGVTITGGIQTIEPTVTNEEESAALGVPLHSPAFLFERTTRSRGRR